MATWYRSFVGGVAIALVCCTVLAAPSTPHDTLRAKHAALAEELAHNAFGQPLHIESNDASGNLRGDVYAVLDHSFATLNAALKGPGQWCDILILHLNVKQCRATAKSLAVSLGKKHEQPLADAYRVDFAYGLAAGDRGYFAVRLTAPSGPLGTKDYRILVEAIPLGAAQSFLHLSYAYGYGFAARMAMQGYLGTVGRNKVGFSVIGRDGDGQPVYVDSMRGVVERNAMRYYLAIDAYLTSLSVPLQQRQEARLREWFAATEHYSRQLHEIDWRDYLAMKRHELQRQQADSSTATAE